MLLKFKKLRIKQNNKEVVLDGYYLIGSVDDYLISKKDENNNLVTTLNPNRCSCFSKESFSNIINNKEDAYYHVSKSKIPTSKEEQFYFSSHEVIEFDFE